MKVQHIVFKMFDSIDHSDFKNSDPAVRAPRLMSAVNDVIEGETRSQTPQKLEIQMV